jgi:VIT1/CCC1 family predicted Fe2+/Mn2+ transporter
MMKRFESRGMPHKDAELVVSKLAQYEDIFVGLMLSEELGLQLSYEDDAMLLTDAFVMFLAFASLGIVPLIVFAAGPLNIFSDEDQYTASVVLSLVVLFVLGSLKSKFGSGNWLYCGFESLALGGACAGVSYFVGESIMKFISYT